MQEYISRIEESLNRNETLVIACNCEVTFDGRANSFLSQGDRLVIIKSDNTVIVHQPTGNAPVNYMKPGAKIHPYIEDKKLILETQNLVLKDYMDIVIHKLYSLISNKLEDASDIIITGTEKDMAEMIYKNPELVEKGFKPVSLEEQTKYGFIDVFGYDKDNVLAIIECKKFTADLKAVDQLRRYVEKIKSSKGIETVRGILASPKISGNALKMLNDFGFSHIHVTPPSFREKFGKKQKSLMEF